jgi:hypothetical protein
MHGEIQGVGSTTAFTDFIMSKSGSGRETGKID